MAPSHTLSFFPPDTLTECPHNCHGNGDCRSGTCHCFPGFLGPDCSRGMLSYSCAHTQSHTTLQRNKQPMPLFIIGFRLSFAQVRLASRLMVDSIPKPERLLITRRKQQLVLFSWSFYCIILFIFCCYCFSLLVVCLLSLSVHQSGLIHKEIACTENFTC